MKRSILLVCCLALTFMGALCNPAKDVTNPTLPGEGGSASLDDGTKCGAMCSRYTALGCKEAKPTNDGATCLQWCVNAEQEGIPLAGAVACSRSASSCEAVTTCSRER